MTGGLAAYPEWVRQLAWQPWPRPDHFSGAAFALGSVGDAPELVAKLWPPAFPAAALAAIHARSQQFRQLGLSEVPEVIPTTDGRTWTPTPSGARLEVMRFRPGVAVRSPSVMQLEAVGTLVGRLAVLGRRHGCEVAYPPCLARRLAACREVAGEFPDVADRLTAELRRWDGVRGPVHPAHGDLRADHLLFTGDRVTGLLDFGVVGVDHVAGDLARALSDYGPDALEPVCAATERVTGDSISRELVRALVVSGLILTACRWAGVAGPDAEARRRGRVSQLARWDALDWAGRFGKLSR